LEGVEQPKILPKNPGNALSDVLLMSCFQNFAVDAAKYKTTLRAVLINELTRINSLIRGQTFWINSLIRGQTFWEAVFFTDSNSKHPHAAASTNSSTSGSIFLAQPFPINDNQPRSATASGRHVAKPQDPEERVVVPSIFHGY